MLRRLTARGAVLTALLVGVVFGGSYAASCSATAGSDDTGSAVAQGRARAVVLITWTVDGHTCTGDPADCCPAGFSAVGIYSPAAAGSMTGAAAVCLEN